jgi:hypothetical protein
MAKSPLSTGISWRQPVVFAVATLLCTVLAICAVVSAPIESSTGAVTGVSGLYLAAAVYVPLALWFGIWGCLAGYASCVFMGLYLNFSGVPGFALNFVLVWALADFFEGFVPLLIYRSLKTKPVLELKKPRLAYTWAFIASLAASITLVLVQGFTEDRKTWLTWLPIGVILASIVSGVFGVGAMAAFGNIPLSAFSTAFFGWVLGDIIVLATLGTILTVTLTPMIVKSKFYVRRYFS